MERRRNSKRIYVIDPFGSKTIGDFFWPSNNWEFER
ncbi:hypothetical protein CCACVL1_27338, partial [Corchorus capsularis]